MKSVLKTVILLFLTTVLVVAFQNCSIQQNTGLLGSHITQSEIAQNIANNAPFAFDLSSDTISYNSCVGDGLNQYGLHGLKIGANGGFIDTTGSGNLKSGLKLSSTFLNYASKSLRPSYPSTVVTPGQISGLLRNSTTNQNAFVQYAVRKRNNLGVMADVISPGSVASFEIMSPRDGYIDSNPIWEDPVGSRLSKYVQFNVDGSLLSEGRRVVNLSDDANPQPIETSFGFSNYTDSSYTSPSGDAVENYYYGFLYAQDVRNKFNSANPDKLILTQTFGDNSTSDGSGSPLSAPLRVKGQESSLNKAYGRGYQLNFTSASPTVAGWQKNLLSSVSEIDLATSQPLPGTSWQCTSFLIMKQDQWDRRDASQAFCAPLIAADFVNPTFAYTVQTLRRHYSDSNWNIGLYYKYDADTQTPDPYDPSQRTSHSICLVPKTAECYLPTNAGGIDSAAAPGGVQYNTNRECYLYLNQSSDVAYSEPTDTASMRARGRCAQFASICIRSTTGN